MGTLVWTDTFDTYTAGINVPPPWVLTTTNPASTAQAHSSPNSLAVGTGGSTSKCYRPFGSNLSQWYADFWMWTNSVGGTTNQVVSFQSTTAGPAVYVNVGASGAGQVGMTSGATWFTFTVTTLAWHHYLFEVTQAVAGTAKLTVDGTVVGTYSGDTRDQSSGPNAYSAYVACIGVTIGPSPPAEYYVDDLSIYSGVVTAGGGAAQARALVLA